MSKNVYKKRLAAAVIAGAFALSIPLGGVAPAVADANFPSVEGTTNTSSILSYSDVVSEMLKIEKNSRFNVDVFTLAEAGMKVNKSEQGRELYAATVGTGPKHVWLQGRIHGNEPYGAEALLAVLKDLGTNGSKDYERIRKEFTLHFIPNYNPDGSEANIRHTILWDQLANKPLLGANGKERLVDLNRDWTPNGFVAKESLAFYEYWTSVKPDYGVDIHHQGLKKQWGTNDDVTFSLGISLAPNGPTLPSIKDGLYNDLTRQMNVHVYDSLKKYGYINTDRYQVGNGMEIDIKGGVVSAMMLGLNYQGLNPSGHSNPVIFFETSGNTSDGSLGQKARGKSIKQNVLGVKALLTGLATGEVSQADPARWEEIPHQPVTGYSTDYAGTIPK